MGAPRLRDPRDGKNLIPKREIEHFRQLIAQKLKNDPELAKKAARILEEMLKEDKNKKK